jgi:putative transposase
MDVQQNDGGMGFPHHRRSTRLSTHDYRWTRAYFVTIRVKTHDPLFEIPQLHQILLETWEGLPQRFPGVTLDEFVIMPDHMHFILWLDGLVKHAPTLGEVVGAYKSLTTVAWIRYSKAAHIDSIGPFWLRNYYDRIIRNHDELERARLYIRNNPHKLATREW